MNGMVKSTAVCRIEVTDMSIFVLRLCHSFCLCHCLCLCLCLSSTGISYWFVLTPVLMNGIVKSTAVCRIEVTDMSIFVLCLCLCHSFCVCHRIFVCLCLSSTGISYLYILTPVLMNGMVKSTAVCRIEVTDISITAMSAFCDLSSAIIPVHLISEVSLVMKMNLGH